MLRKDASFIRAQKEQLQKHFIMCFLICPDESPSYYGVQVNIRAGSVVWNPTVICAPQVPNSLVPHQKPVRGKVAVIQSM